MKIAFTINPLGLEGLGATLTSLVRNCSDNKELGLYFLCSGLRARDKQNISRLLQNENFKGSTEFIDFNAKEKFGHLRPLHGDWTTYGRLLIPDVIKTGNVLYLDSDLIIKVDVLKLNEFKTDKILSACYGGTVAYALEHNFFMQVLKWHPGTGCFNAGVLLINTSKWNEENITGKIKTLAYKYPNEFLSADQTLNAVFEGDFAHLPKTFNTPWQPAGPDPETTDKMIIHFVGSPKPWDLFGRKMHSGFNLWHLYNTRFWESNYSKITINKLRRTWEIRTSIFKKLKSRKLIQSIAFG